MTNKISFPPGLLDSATVRDSTGTGKEFMLRDDTDSIKCVFYEIVSPNIFQHIIKYSQFRRKVGKKSAKNLKK